VSRGAAANDAQDLLEAIWKKNPHGLFPDPAYAREAILSLRSRDAKARHDEIENNARKFRVVIGANIESRVLLATDDGHLVLGSQSTRQGDEVWVISGCKVPIVLRRVEEAARMAYTVVGQCFVPHAMLGEFLGKDNETNSFKAVKLV
jgi:hypothetical protein